MPKQRTKERIVCEHFVWLLGKRGDVFTADGRSNKPPLGRHSLGTKTYEEAIEILKRLDLVKAVEVGRVDSSALKLGSPELLGLHDGRERYLAHVQRPRVGGGAKKRTPKRYQAVFEKFIPFVLDQGIHYWNGVTKRALEAYAAFLDGKGYAYSTEYLKLTTLKQAMKWYVLEKLLPVSCQIVGLSMAKPTGTDTYCWKPDEVSAMIDHCYWSGELTWLGDVILALASTGLRISELASLRWADVDLEKNVILLTDESRRAPRRQRRAARETKNSRSRSFPIHTGLHKVLERMAENSQGILFRGPRGGKLKPDTVRTILVRDVLKKLADRFPTLEDEIGFADGRLHSFRHYFYSTCANEGVPEHVVMSWLGHSSRMVSHYYHLHDEESQKQMQRLDFAGTRNHSGRKRSAG